ncbi:beta-lactamase-like protein [Flammula alnicola]|nr:beta-lactamase-like protein [Flammula alnicola]
MCLQDLRDEGALIPIPDLEDEASTSKPFSKFHSEFTIKSSLTSGPKDQVGCDAKGRENGNNAFSVLMTSFKENEVWKEASIAERKAFPQQKSKGGRRKAPFYKVLQGMPIAVDAFRYGAIPGVTAYFLTHAHSDHYTNLSSNWKNGPIYCSQGTANLIVHMLSVDRKWVHPLPMDTPTLVPNTNGVMVTLIEANHCPGSCLFFFEGLQTVNAGDSTYKSHFVGSSRTFRYLHCGDFRASPRHVLHPAVKGKAIDHVYLDTTYLDPKYTFPPQALVISACAELAKRLVDGQPLEDKKSIMLSWMSPSDSKGKEKERLRPLVVIGTYSIGKERIVKAIAQALNTKVYCDARKSAILKCQSDPELDALLTANPLDAIVHLVPLGSVTSDHLKTYLDRFKGSYSKIIAFRPTGWTYTQAAGTNQLPTISSILQTASSLKDYKHTDLKVSAQSTPALQLYPVPYSEHSSFYELTCFAMSFPWIKMIATVNVGSETSRGKMAKWVAKWEAERRKTIEDTIVPYRHPDYW